MNRKWTKALNQEVMTPWQVALFGIGISIIPSGLIQFAWALAIAGLCYWTNLPTPLEEEDE